MFLSFGLLWLTAWGSRSTAPQHTTRKLTGCANGFTCHLRPRSGFLNRWRLGQPWVLLGLRSAVKEDLGFELVLGQPLRVPGEFLPESPPPCFHTSLLPFRPPRNSFHVPGPVHPCLPDTFVPSSLDSARFVFVRHHAHRTPLRPPYDGPYRVLKPGNKHFILDFGGRQEVVSVDRLKPAHVMQEDQVVPAQDPLRGRPPATGLMDSVFSPRSDPQSTESESSAVFSERAPLTPSVEEVCSCVLWRDMCS